MGRLLLETGDDLLQESGSLLLLDGELLFLSVAGTDRSAGCDWSTLSLIDQLNEEPNTLAVELFGFTPAMGDSLTLKFGYRAGSKTLFTGTVLTVRRLRWKSTQGRVVFAVTAVDGTHTLDAALVTKAYASQSATTIVTNLITTYAPTITTNAVAASLASVATEFKMQRLSDALTQIANLVGAFWYLDVDNDLHFFVAAETADVPDDLDSANTDVREFTYEQDRTQIRNRVLVEGLGTTISAARAAGSTTLPIEDATSFGSSGTNYAITGNQILSYTGKTAGGTVGSVAAHNQAAPTGAPSVAEGAAGQLEGTYLYKVSFGNPTGETAVGPASASVAPSAFSTPGAPAAGTSSSVWGGLDVGSGNYKWRVTFVTARGETTGGSVSSSYSGTSLEGLMTTIGAPSSTTGGAMALGTYYYDYTWETAQGETRLRGVAQSHTLGGANNAVNFTAAALPDPPVGATIKLYRTVVGGSSSGPFYFVAKIDATAAYTDKAADAQLGGESPNSDTAGARAFDLSSIATGPTGVLARRVYRTRSGGSEYFFVGQISDNTTTVMTDAVPDNALGAYSPVVNSAGGHAVNLSSLPTGGAAITRRILYRTKAGGSEYFRVAAIDDNTTTTYTDDALDTALQTLAPTRSTIAADPGDTSLRVRLLENFSATGGWIAIANQILRYTGRSGSSGEGTLTGIPASGEGAILVGIPADLEVLPWAFLTGIPASGDGSLISAVIPGDELHVLVYRNDTASQATYGIREQYVQDRRLSITGAQNRGDAELTIRKDPIIRGAFRATDWKLRSGKPLTVNHWGLSFTATIMRVTMAMQDGHPLPMRQVEYATLIDRQSLYYLLRQFEREHL